MFLLRNFSVAISSFSCSAKLDIEVAALLNSSPEYTVEKSTSDLKRQRFGKIDCKEWSVTYPSKEGNDSVKKMFFLRDKHLYQTQALKKILDLVNKTSVNSEADKKCFNEMLN